MSQNPVVVHTFSLKVATRLVSRVARWSQAKKARSTLKKSQNAPKNAKSKINTQRDL